MNVYKVEIRGQIPAFDVEVYLVFAENEDEIRGKLGITDKKIVTDAELITPDVYYLGLIEYDGTIVQKKAPTEAEMTGLTGLEGVDASYCPLCGGTRTWCEGCQMWTSLCCETYGTCMCS